MAVMQESSSPLEGAVEHGPDHAHGIYAAIDLGTNNCRMLVARPVNGERCAAGAGDFRVIDSFSRITRLGEGVSRSGELSADAMDRTVDALKRCAEKMQRRRVTASRHRPL